MNRSITATCLALFSVVGWSLTQADASMQGESCAAPQVGAANCSMPMGCPVACQVMQAPSCAGYAAPSCAGYAEASCSGSHGMSRREQRMARKAAKHGHSATVAYVVQAAPMQAYCCPTCNQ